MRPLLIGLALLIAAAPMFPPIPMAVARDLNHDEALRLRREGVVVSLQSLLDGPVAARYPGFRLLEAELEEDDGRYVYEIELLTATGAARELEFDARDGRLLQDKAD